MESPFKLFLYFKMTGYTRIYEVIDLIGSYKEVGIRRYRNLLDFFFTIFYKGHNFCDILFATCTPNTT